METRINFKNKYVLGFMFSQNKINLLLIHKNRPDWQKDRLNGIGGKIKNYKELLHPELAMEREFEEETGIKYNNWKHFCTMNFSNNNTMYDCIVFCFYTLVPQQLLYSAQSKTDEKICIININELGILKIKPIENLYWLIPMALHEELFSNMVFYSK